MMNPWRATALSVALACVAVAAACNDPLHPKGPSGGGGGSGGGSGGDSDSGDSGARDAGNPGPTPSCNSCALQACVVYNNICRANPDCVAIVTSCGDNVCRYFDLPCLDACAQQYPAGYNAYANWAACRVNAACSTCSSSCVVPPQVCGLRTSQLDDTGPDSDAGLDADTEPSSEEFDASAD